MWAEDLERMLAAGIGTIRIGEFAWALLEPREGTYCFELFQAFLDLCDKKGMQVIFGTPTATPPAWLTRKYPEVLNCRMDGVPYRHGARRHCNYNAPKYIGLCGRVVEQLSIRYAKHPAICGWQIDNELNCQTDEFYSQADSVAFRAYLREKYGSLDALNDAMGAVFWSETYTDWEEIAVPQVVVSDAYNPHMMLEYSRFRTINWPGYRLRSTPIQQS